MISNSIAGVMPQGYSNPYGGAGSGGGENEDLKQERKQEARRSLIESIEAFKISEQKKNIDAIR